MDFLQVRRVTEHENRNCQFGTFTQKGREGETAQFHVVSTWNNAEQFFVCGKCLRLYLKEYAALFN